MGLIQLLAKCYHKWVKGVRIITFLVTFSHFFLFSHSIPCNGFQIRQNSNRDKYWTAKSWELVEPILESAWWVLSWSLRWGKIWDFAWTPHPIPLTILHVSIIKAAKFCAVINIYNWLKANSMDIHEIFLSF